MIVMMCAQQMGHMKPCMLAVNMSALNLKQLKNEKNLFFTSLFILVTNVLDAQTFERSTNDSVVENLTQNSTARVNSRNGLCHH
jgi:hypothetical protein